MPSKHKFRNPPLGAPEEGLCFLSKLCWGFLMFLCLKEDGDGPGGAFCPLDQVLENALVKDSFCLYFPSIPYFSQQEIVCAVIYKKKAVLLYLLLAFKGLSKCMQKGEKYFDQPPPALHLAWALLVLLFSQTSVRFRGVCSFLWLGHAYEFSSWIMSEVMVIKTHHQLC